MSFFILKQILQYISEIEKKTCTSSTFHSLSFEIYNQTNLTLALAVLSRYHFEKNV